jgi:hypothetical protein
MTKKIIRTWHRMSFWTTLLAVITPLTIGGELAVYATGINPVFHYLVFGAAVAATVIKHAIAKDENKNGIIDSAESDTTPK